MDILQRKLSGRRLIESGQMPVEKRTLDRHGIDLIDGAHLRTFHLIGDLTATALACQEIGRERLNARLRCSVDKIDQMGKCIVASLRPFSLNRGQRRYKSTCGFQVIKSGHNNIFRKIVSVIDQVRHHAHRHDVIGTDKSIRKTILLQPFAEFILHHIEAPVALKCVFTFCGKAVILHAFGNRAGSFFVFFIPCDTGHPCDLPDIMFRDKMLDKLIHATVVFGANTVDPLHLILEAHRRFIQFPDLLGEHRKLTCIIQCISEKQHAIVVFEVCKIQDIHFTLHILILFTCRRIIDEQIHIRILLLCTFFHAFQRFDEIFITPAVSKCCDLLFHGRLLLRNT